MCNVDIDHFLPFLELFCLGVAGSFPDTGCGGCFSSFTGNTFYSHSFLPVNDSFELIRIGTNLISISTFFNGIEGLVCCLAVVVGGPAEHLRLDPDLYQTFRDFLDQLSHLDGRFLIRTLLVEEVEHLSDQWLAHYQLNGNFFVLLLQELLFNGKFYQRTILFKC